MDWIGLDLTFPITDPTWIFLLVLLLILFAPILLNKLRLPNIIGMILACDSSFELALLYHVPGWFGNEYGGFQRDTEQGVGTRITRFSHSYRNWIYR